MNKLLFSLFLFAATDMSAADREKPTKRPASPTEEATTAQDSKPKGTPKRSKREAAPAGVEVPAPVASAPIDFAALRAAREARDAARRRPVAPTTQPEQEQSQASTSSPSVTPRPVSPVAVASVSVQPAPQPRPTYQADNTLLNSVKEVAPTIASNRLLRQELLREKDNETASAVDFQAVFAKAQICEINGELDHNNVVLLELHVALAATQEALNTLNINVLDYMLVISGALQTAENTINSQLLQQGFDIAIFNHEALLAAINIIGLARTNLATGDFPDAFNQDVIIALFSTVTQVVEATETAFGFASQEHAAQAFNPQDAADFDEA